MMSFPGCEFAKLISHWATRLRHGHAVSSGERFLVACQSRLERSVGSAHLHNQLLSCRAPSRPQCPHVEIGMSTTNPGDQQAWFRAAAALPLARAASLRQELASFSLLLSSQSRLLDAAWFFKCQITRVPSRLRALLCPSTVPGVEASSPSGRRHFWASVWSPTALPTWSCLLHDSGSSEGGPLCLLPGLGLWTH